MDYSDPKPERVMLDTYTEKEIHSIKDTLKQMVSGLESLNQKVDRLSRNEHMERPSKD